MTVNLSPILARLIEREAQENDTSADALVSEILADYFEEQRDIAEAQEIRRQIKEGETELLEWEAVRAEIMAMEDMQGLVEEDDEDL